MQMQVRVNPLSTPPLDPRGHERLLTGQPPRLLAGLEGQQQYGDAYREASQARSVGLRRQADQLNATAALASDDARYQESLGGLSALASRRNSDLQNIAARKQLLGGLFQPTTFQPTVFQPS